MNIHKIILAVLVAVTIAVGTTTVTVYAAGPNINGFMDAATTARFQQMTPAWQGMVREAWGGLVTTIAPRDEWDEVAAHIVSQMYEDARSQRKLRGNSPAPSVLSTLGALLGISRASRSCDGSGSTMLSPDGWAGSSTTSTCRKDFLKAQIAVQVGGGPGDLRVCFSCTSVLAYATGLSCGYYNVIGHHEWGENPTGGETTTDIGQSGC